jgi:molybdopterin-binding protein
MTDWHQKWFGLVFAVAAPQAHDFLRDDGPGLTDQQLSADVRLRRAWLNPRGIIMRISARNQIKGTVVEVKKGATTSHVRVDIGGGQIVTSSITNEAVDDLGLKTGGAVVVVVKASDVMIAVD